MTTIPAIYRGQSYKAYDQALASWIHEGVRLRSDKKVILVFASPERAFAEVAKRLKITDPGDPIALQKRVPLPFSSLNFIAAPYDAKRENSVRLTRVGYQPGDLTSYTVPWPIPVTLIYEWTLWTRTLDDLQEMGDQFLMLFSKGMLALIDVVMPGPLGTLIVQTQMAEDKRLPVIQGDDKQVLMQRVFTIRMSGWIARPAEEHHIAEHIQSDFYQQDTQDHLGTVLVPDEE